MPTDSGSIRSALLNALPSGANLCVAFSGGRDSTVLLHALAGLRESASFTLRAAHVNHQLQEASNDWEEHSAATARQLGVPFIAHRVVVCDRSKQGVEAAARDARYAVLSGQLRTGERLLTAHHADDQLETVLLHLMRGSGVTGLAGIPRDAVVGAGRLCRPLLGVDAEAIEAYAQTILRPQGIAWLQDPMNADEAYDRGFLRQSVTPVMRQRFPAAARAAGRSAVLAAEAAELLDDLARVDDLAVVDGDVLLLAPLRRLSPARQRNVLRFVVRGRGWALPPERRLREGLAQLLHAGFGKQPVMRWGSHEIRRYRESLYLLDGGIADAGAEDARLWDGLAPLRLGATRGELALCEGAGAGLAPGVVAGGLTVAFRGGGERFRGSGDRYHRTLKYLFQSHGIVPWMRQHVPLILAGEELAAVADLWTADWAAAGPGERGLQIVWSGHAPIQ